MSLESSGRSRRRATDACGGCQSPLPTGVTPRRPVSVGDIWGIAFPEGLLSPPAGLLSSL